jgi:hypothetical protein
MDTRREQLRAAKQRQRSKERQAGYGLYQLKLPLALREKLKAGMRDPRFVRRLFAFLNNEVVKVDDYPNLALLCWNQHMQHVTRRDAFDLYERNWRLLDDAALGQHERAFIDELTQEFGRGVVNA